VIRRLVARLPVWMQEGPIGSMCVLLGIPAGIAALVGPASSRALDTLLPVWARILWAGCLIVGCVAWGIGLTSVRNVGGVSVITRLPSMLLGLRLIANAAIVYAIAIIVVSGWAGMLAAWPLGVVAFGTTIEWAVLDTRRRR
jgi:hypothetical protein